jgi:transcriptional regulator with XRE-family HTH domain
MARHEDSHKLAERFGKTLFLTRRRACLSQEELAFYADLHRTEIGHLENGRRVARIDTLVKLAGVLEVATDDLLEGIVWVPRYENRPGGDFIVRSAGQRVDG